MKKVFSFASLFIFCFTSLGFAFEREQDIPTMFQNERDLMLHFMQGKEFFKKSEYERARKEFLSVIQINSDYHPAYEYLERIQDKAIEMAEKEGDRRSVIKDAMDNLGKPSSDLAGLSEEDLFYQLTDLEQKKLDTYVGDKDFSHMVEDQKITVMSRANQMKKNIDKVLGKTRKKDVMKHIVGRDEPFVVQGLDHHLSQDFSMRSSVARVAEAQREVDANFWLHRRKQLENFYKKGVEAYKLRDYDVAKGLFEKVLSIDPSYKYAHDYHQSSRDKLIKIELQNKHNTGILSKFRKNKKPRMQDPIESRAQDSLWEESLKMTAEMSEDFQERKGALLTGHRDDLVKEGLKCMEDKDFNRALSIFEDILRYDPKDKKVLKYRKEALSYVAKKEEMLLESLGNFDSKELAKLSSDQFALDQKKTIKSPLSTIPKKNEKHSEEADFSELYDKGKEAYREEKYDLALRYFLELEGLDPNHRYVKKYILRCQKLLVEKDSGQGDFSAKKMYKKAKKLYKDKKHRESVDLCWKILRVEPKYKKAKKLLKKGLKRLGLTMEDVLKEFSLKEEVRSGDLSISKMLPSSKVVFQKDDKKSKTTSKEKDKPLVVDVAKKNKKQSETEDEILSQATPIVKALNTEELDSSNEGLFLSDQVSIEMKNDRNMDFDFYENYERGRELFRQSNYKEAVPFFREAVKVSPKHRYANRYLEICLKKSDVSEAIAAKNVFDAFYERGRELFRQGLYFEAIPFFEKAVEMIPNHRYAKRFLDISTKKGESDETSFDALFEEGKALYESGKYSEAITFLEKAKILKPNDSSVLSLIKTVNDQKNQENQKNTDIFAKFYEKAKYFYRRAEFQDAISQFEKALSFRPDHKYAREYLSRSKDKLSKQQERTKKTRVKKLSDFDNIYEKGKRLYREEKYREARDFFQKAVKLKPDHRYAPIYLKRCTQKVMEKQKSEKNDKSGAVNDKEVAFKDSYEKGKTLYRSKEYEKAIQHFEQAVKLKPDHRYAPAYLKRCKEKALEKKNEDKESLASQKVDEKDKKKEDAFEKFYEKGKYFYRKDDFQKAIEQFEQAVNLKPDHRYAPAYLKRSQEKLLKKKNNTKDKAEGDSAKPEVQKEEDPFDKFYNKGKYFYRRDNFEKAIEQFEQAVKLKPDHRYAPMYLKRSKEKLQSQKADQSQNVLYKDKQTGGVSMGKNERFPSKNITNFQAQSTHKDLVGGIDAQAEKELMLAVESDDMAEKDDRGYFKGKDSSFALVSKSKDLAESLAWKPAKIVKSFVRKPSHLAKKILSPLNFVSSKKKKDSEVDKMLHQAIHLFDEAEYARARTLLHSVLEFYPDHKVALHYLKFIKSQIDFSKTPHGLSDERTEKQAKDIYLRAVGAYKRGEFETALVLLEESKKMSPKNKSIQKALELTRQRLIDEEKKRNLEARERSQKREASLMVESELTQVVDQLFRDGKAHYSEGAFETAADDFYLLKLMDPDYPSVYKYLRQSVRNLSRDVWTKRKDYLDEKYKDTPYFLRRKQTLGLSPRVKMKHRDFFNKGMSFYRRKKFRRALDLFEKARDIDPYLNNLYFWKKSTVYFLEMKADKKRGEIDKVKTKSDYILSGDPTNSLAKRYSKWASSGYDFYEGEHKNLVNIEEKLNEAKRETERKEALLKKFEEGKSFYKSGLYLEALRVFNLVLKKDPQHEYARVFALYASRRIEDQKKLDADMEKIRRIAQEGSDKSQSFLSAKKDLIRVRGNISKKRVIDGAEFVREAIIFDGTENEKMLEVEKKISELLNNGKKFFDKAQYNLAEGYFNQVLAMKENHVIARDYNHLIHDHFVKQKALEKKVMETFEKGVIFYQQGQYQRALTFFEEVLKEFPDHKDAQVFHRYAKNRRDQQIKIRRQLDPEKSPVAKVLLNRKDRDLDGSLELFSKTGVVLKNEGKALLNILEKESVIDDWLQEGISFFEEEDYDKAEEYFKKIQVNKEGCAIAQSYLILIKKKREERQKLQKNIDIEFRRGLNFYQKGLYDEALNVFNSILEKDPNHLNVEIFISYAQQRLAERKKVFSEIKSEKEEKIAKNSALKKKKEQEIFLSKGVIPVDRITSEGKILRLEDILNQEESINALLKKGVIAFENKKDQEALSYFQKVINLRETSVVAHDYTKLIRERMHEKALVEEKIEKNFKRGLLLYQREKYAEALLIFKETLSKRPEHSYAKILIDYCEDRMAEKKDMEIKIAFHSGGEEVIRQKGNIPNQKILSKGDVLNVSAFLDQEAQRSELLGKGEVLLKKGKESEAIAVFQEVLAIDANCSIARDYIHLIKDKVEKRETLRKEVISGFQNAVNLYEKEMYEQALQLFYKVLEKDPKHKYAPEFIKYAKQRIENAKNIESNISTPHSDDDLSLKVVAKIDRQMSERKEHKNKTTKNSNANVQKKSLTKERSSKNDKSAIALAVGGTQSTKALSMKKQLSKDTYTDLGLIYKNGINHYEKGEYDKALVSFKKIWSLDENFEQLDNVQSYIENIYDHQAQVSSTPKQQISEKSFNQKKKSNGLKKLSKESVLRDKKDVSSDIKANDDLVKKAPFRDRNNVEGIPLSEAKGNSFLTKDNPSKTKSFQKISNVRSLREISKTELLKVDLKTIPMLKGSIGKEMINKDIPKGMPKEKLLEKGKDQVKGVEKNDSWKKYKDESKKVSKLFSKGKDFLEEGDSDMAITLFKEVLKLDPEHHLASKYLKISQEQDLVEAQKKEKVYSLEEKEDKSDVSELEISYQKGVMYFKRKLYNRALVYFKRVKLLDKDLVYLSDVQNYIDKISQQKEESSPRKSSLERHYEMGQKMFVAQKWEKARAVFEKISKIDKNYRSVQMYLQVVSSEMKVQKPNVELSKDTSKVKTLLLKKSEEKLTEGSDMEGETKSSQVESLKKVKSESLKKKTIEKPVVLKKEDQKVA
ncbi:hypothetical protein AB834_02670 [PVC group bacterium (ex Bugula neritina AB1)]|nr:hypothetical protein AB834_02670 [PVC group bacterium (ex Bugula neritina AB1)]